MDALKRHNQEMTTAITSAKGQLAHLKGVQEDMEATCQHALLERQAALKELEGLRKKQAGRGSFSFFRSSDPSSSSSSAAASNGSNSSSCLSPQPKGVPRAI